MAQDGQAGAGAAETANLTAIKGLQGAIEFAPFLMYVVGLIPSDKDSVGLADHLVDRTGRWLLPCWE